MQTNRLTNHHHAAADTPSVPTTTNRHIEFHDNREVRAGVVLQIGGTEVVLAGVEFWALLKAAKQYANDWGNGERPSRSDINNAIRELKQTGGYVRDRHQ